MQCATHTMQLIVVRREAMQPDVQAALVRLTRDVRRLRGPDPYLGAHVSFS